MWAPQHDHRSPEQRRPALVAVPRPPQIPASIRDPGTGLATDTPLHHALARTVRERARRAPEQILARKLKEVDVQGERVLVAKSSDAARASQIIDAIRNDYGVDVCSNLGYYAMRDTFDLVDEAKVDAVTSAAWSMRDLEAIYEGLLPFAPILGQQRAGSSRSAKPQEVTAFARMTHGFTANDASGKSDVGRPNESYAQYHRDEGIITLYGHSKKLSRKNLVGTIMHEAAHGLFRYVLNGYGGLAAYSEPAKMPGYGSVSIEEDLCEAVRMYFQEPDRLAEIRPVRYAYLDDHVMAW